MPAPKTAYPRQLHPFLLVCSKSPAWLVVPCLSCVWVQSFPIEGEPSCVGHTTARMQEQLTSLRPVGEWPRTAAQHSKARFSCQILHT